MIYLRLHDSLSQLFGDVEAEPYIAAVRTAFRTEDWSPLLGIIFDRDQALLHAAECSDCINDLLIYLEIRDRLDYKESPCLHLAYFSTTEALRCIGNVNGDFSILLSGKEDSGVGIGFCPWCSVPVPDSNAEKREAEQLGLRNWQRKQVARF
jgi:hypothetical protein